MKSCAYCGRENDDDATRCRECGTTEFAVPEPEADQRLEATAEIPEPESDVAPEGEAMLCTSCLFPNLPEAMRCKRCGAPTSSNAMILMPDAAFAFGFVYRRAVEAPSKLIVVLGIWIHFLPGLISDVLLLLFILAGGIDGWRGFAGIVLALVYGAISGSMIFRVTRNYFRMHRHPSIDDALGAQRS